MKERFSRSWHKVSRLGLREDEGILAFREVILLNRIIALVPIILILYAPVEIVFNGIELLPLTGSLILVFLLTLLLHSYRWFRFARYYTFLVTTLFISAMGIVVGKGVNNHVFLIPMALFGIILFKSKTERIISLFIVIALYLLQRYLMTVIAPLVDLDPETEARFTRIFFILGIILCFLLGYYFVGITGEYEAIILRQKEEISLTNMEITDSIAYAKRIQKAILPPDKLVKEYLPDSFILYKPKDIVAGDFYWVEKTRNNILFAVADCTGHGVPGAMVSVVCNNALNRSFHESGLTNPAEILNKTRQMVIREFDKSEEEIKDGMDISICAFDPPTRTLRWAGANNPLLILRAGTLTEVKPDKQPIGNFTVEQPFTSHTFVLEKGDQVYIFSDGYADQFGGPKGKKLKYPAFKNLLVSHASQSMEEQKNLLEQALEAWKGELAQVDDICVMGMRIG